MVSRSLQLEKWNKFFIGNPSSSQQIDRVLLNIVQYLATHQSLLKKIIEKSHLARKPKNYWKIGLM